jgi:hypothetical protein
MKEVTGKILNGLIAILFLDILGSIASNRLGFNYSLLSPISFSVYSAVGFSVAKHSNKKTAVVSTAILGLFDATVGWWVSIVLQANTGALNKETTMDNVLGTIISMSLIASSFGLLGSWIGKYKLWLSQ